jgi:hypothetical protein
MSLLEARGGMLCFKGYVWCQVDKWQRLVIVNLVCQLDLIKRYLRDYLNKSFGCVCEGDSMDS